MSTTADMKPDNAYTAKALTREFVATVAPRWRRFLAWTVIGAVVVGVLVFVLRPPVSSTATVFVSPLEASPFSPDPRGQTLTNLETEAQVAKSDAVLEKAAATLGDGTSAGRLGNALTVSIPPSSQVLELKVAGGAGVDPTAAVDAVAAAYLDVRQESAVNSVNSRARQIAGAQAEAQKRLARAAKAVSESSDGSAARRVAEQELTIASSELATLGTEQADLAAASTYPGEILNPGTSSGLGIPWAAILAGAVIGFVVPLIIYGRRDFREARSEGRAWGSSR